MRLAVPYQVPSAQLVLTSWYIWGWLQGVTRPTVGHCLVMSLGLTRYFESMDESGILHASTAAAMLDTYSVWSGC